MASTYSTNLKLELIGTGEQSGVWGTTTNTNMGTAIEQAIVGRGSPVFSTDADLTLTLSNSSAAQTARAFVLNVTSGVSLTATRNLVVPTIEKPYVVMNNTTGGQSIVVKTAAGSGITVPNGGQVFLYVDGTNVIQMLDAFGDLTYTGTLTGGTGVVNLGSGQFVKDASGNVGIGTASPANRLHVKSGATTTVVAIESTGTSVFAQLKNSGASAFLGADSTGAFQIQTPGSGYSTKLTVDTSGNLGLGVTPSAWLSGCKSLDISAYSSFGDSGGSTVVVNNAYRNSGGGWVYKNTAAATVMGTDSGSFYWYTAPSGTAGNAISFTQAMALNASGNMGVSVTPSTWNASIKALSVGRAGSSVYSFTGSNIVGLTCNASYIASDWTYVSTDAATRYQQNAGLHTWYTAPSGTAGNPISFTQAMTLDANGKLTNNASSHNVAAFNGTGGAGGYVTFENSATVYGDIGTANQIVSGGSVSDFGINARGARNLIFGTNNAERVRIDTSGNLTLSAGAMGYGTGAGGTVTQVTSRTTAVTLNKPSGAINMLSATGSATWSQFYFYNSFISATDTVSVSVKVGASNYYLLSVVDMQAGACVISFATTGGTTVDAPVINFAVIKGATA